MTTERARAVPNAMHAHDTAAGGITTTNLATSVYGGTPTSIDADDAGAAGTATTISRSDHQHAFACATAGTISPDATAAEGSAATMARSDHVHGITCSAASDMARTNSSSEGSSGNFARADHGHGLGVLPWGVVARQVLTANSSGITADGATDMVLNNVSVIAGHLYAVIISGLAGFSAAVGQFQLNLHVNGTYVDTFTRLVNLTAVAQRWPINGLVTWEAPITQATDDFTVVADERVDGSTLTLIGGTTTDDPPRTMLVVDLGDAP